MSEKTRPVSSDDEQSYYPRWKCKLIVYLEDLGKKVYDGKAPPKPVKNLKGKSDERAKLERVEDPLAPPGVRRFILLPAGKNTNKPGDPQTQILDESLVFTIDGVVPHEFNISRNPIRIADTMTLAFRFIELPIDPRLVRACGIKFYLGTVTAEEHAEGLRESRITGIPSTGMIDETWTDEETGQRRTNERFSGFVDKWLVDWPDNAEPIVHMECRDNTQLLIDTEAPTDLVLDAKVPIDQAIIDYLAHFPQMYGMSVEWRGEFTGETPPSLDSVLAGTAFRPELGPSPSKGGGGGEKLAVWDFLTDVVMSMGFTIRIEDNNIIVQNTRSLYTARPGSTSRADDPFQGRDGNPYRRWFYGRNVLSMKTSRNYQRTPVNIEVRCYSPQRKKVIVGRYPPTDNKQSDPKGGGVENKWKVWRVTGVKDEATLVKIAQNIYEAQGRNDLEINVKTKNLASFGGKNIDPDVLDMRAGDTFELFINRDDEEMEANTITKGEAALVVMERGVRFLKDLGFPEDFVRTYTKLYVNAGFQTAFKSKMIVFSGSINEGVNIDVTGINYIEVNADRISDHLEKEAGGTDAVTADKPTPKKNIPVKPPETATKPAVGPSAPITPPKNPGPPKDAPAPAFAFKNPLVPSTSPAAAPSTSTGTPLFTLIKPVGGS